MGLHLIEVPDDPAQARIKRLVLHAEYRIFEGGRVTEAWLLFADGAVVVGHCMDPDPNPLDASYRSIVAYNSALGRAAKLVEVLRPLSADDAGDGRE